MDGSVSMDDDKSKLVDIKDQLGGFPCYMAILFYIKIECSHRISYYMYVGEIVIDTFTYTGVKLDNLDKFVYNVLVKELKSISKDVRLGFGAFVDKPNIMPFAGTTKEAIDNPCYPDEPCSPMYGFHNILALTNDTSLFGPNVDNTSISANQDGPEGGFDALLQIMVCEVCNFLTMSVLVLMSTL